MLKLGLRPQQLRTQPMATMAATSSLRAASRCGRSGLPAPRQCWGLQRGQASASDARPHERPVGLQPRARGAAHQARRSAQGRPIRKPLTPGRGVRARIGGARARGRGRGLSAERLEWCFSACCLSCALLRAMGPCLGQRCARSDILGGASVRERRSGRGCGGRAPARDKRLLVRRRRAAPPHARRGALGRAGARAAAGDANEPQPQRSWTRLPHHTPWLPLPLALAARDTDSCHSPTPPTQPRGGFAAAEALRTAHAPRRSACGRRGRDGRAGRGRRVARVDGGGVSAHQGAPRVRAWAMGGGAAAGGLSRAPDPSLTRPPL